MEQWRIRISQLQLPACSRELKHSKLLHSDRVPRYRKPPESPPERPGAPGRPAEARGARFFPTASTAPIRLRKTAESGPGHPMPQLGFARKPKSRKHCAGPANDPEIKADTRIPGKNSGRFQEKKRGNGPRRGDNEKRGPFSMFRWVRRS